MATTTQNLGLIEPAGTDHALVANINTNSEKIDAEAGKARANFALVQNGDTATQAISQGQLVVWKGALKKATANIANGATLSGSNLSDDSIATEIASLNSNKQNTISYVSYDSSNAYQKATHDAIEALNAEECKTATLVTSNGFHFIAMLQRSDPLRSAFYLDSDGKFRTLFSNDSGATYKTKSI